MRQVHRRGSTVTRQELANLGNILITNSAKVAELADAPDLGSSARHSEKFVGRCTHQENRGFSILAYDSFQSFSTV